MKNTKKVSHEWSDSCYVDSGSFSACCGSTSELREKLSVNSSVPAELADRIRSKLDDVDRWISKSLKTGFVLKEVDLSACIEEDSWWVFTITVNGQRKLTEAETARKKRSSTKASLSKKLRSLKSTLKGLEDVSGIDTLELREKLQTEIGSVTQRIAGL